MSVPGADYEQWVRDGQRVTARYAHGEGIRAQGRVISYTDRPTVTIVLESGERESWIADLCEPIPRTNAEQAWAELEELMGYNVGSISDQDRIREYVRIIEAEARRAPHRGSD